MQVNTNVVEKNETTPNIEINEMIAIAAYYKAEKRGFTPGFEEQDWFQPEHEIATMLNS